MRVSNENARNQVAQLLRGDLNFFDVKKEHAVKIASAQRSPQISTDAFRN
jgi:hypothetical protein